MRKLALLTFQTLDGVMQAPSEPGEDDSDDFQHGGWAAPYWEEVMEQVRRVAMADPYDMLFGRKTYELFAPHWSAADPDSPEARRMNSARKYVVTNSLKEFSWTNSTALSGEDLPGEIAALKQQEGPLLQVHGSWQLIQMLLKQNLVDELRLWTFPILVGRGKRLFGRDIPLHRFDLITSDRTQQGVFHSLYQRKE